MIDNIANSGLLLSSKPTQHSVNKHNMLNSKQNLNSAEVNRVNSSEFQKILRSNSGSDPLNTSRFKTAEPSIKHAGKNQDDGIDFALRKVSIDFEKQILGIMWNMAAQTNRTFEGGLGEEIFYQELINEMVNLSKPGEMGDIAKNIYKDLKREQNATTNDE